MFDHRGLAASTKRGAFLLLLAMSCACQKYLPVVDEESATAGGGAEAARDSVNDGGKPAGGTGAAGRGGAGPTGMAGSASTPNPGSTGCEDDGPPELVRRDKLPSSARDLIRLGDTFYFVEFTPTKSASLGTAAIYKMALDGTQEQLVFTPNPPRDITHLAGSGDTLYFTAAEDLLAPTRTIQSLSLSTGATKVITTLKEGDPNEGVLGVDDQYLYVAGYSTVGMRLSLSDGKRTDLPFHTNHIDVKSYDNLLWYAVDEADAMRPAGRYQLDPRAAMPSEVRVGAPLCTAAADWIMTDTSLFCAQQNGLYRYDRDATTRDGGTLVFRIPATEGGLGNEATFNAPAGDVVYFTMLYSLTAGRRAIRRLNMRTNTVEVVSCNHADMASLVLTDTQLYWVESFRLAEDKAKGGIYRIRR